MEKFLKDLFKKVKLNESTISTLIGAVVILLVGILILNYFKKEETEQLGQELQKQEEKAQQEMMAKMLEEKYTVQKGDSLWKIAVGKYSDGYQWPKIAQANNLANPDYLEEGQELELP